MQTPCRFRFTKEALQYIFLLVGIEFALDIKRFDCHGAVYLGVRTKIDHAHCALADATLNGVASKRGLVLSIIVFINTFIIRPNTCRIHHDRILKHACILGARLDILELRIVAAHITVD